MRVICVFFWLFVLCVPIGVLAGQAFTLQAGAFPQRMADRYTTAHGLPGKRVTAIKVDGDAVFVETEGGQAVFENGRWQRLEASRKVDFAAMRLPEPPPGKRVLSVAQGPDKRIWVVTDAGAFRREGGKYVPVTKPTSYLTRQPPVNVDAEFTCVAVDRMGHVWFGTDSGLAATDGKNWWNVIDGSRGLPYEEVTCLTFGRDGEFWVGTTQGVCRYTASGRWQYYWGPRYLPGNHVHAIALDREGAAWVATDGGVARLYDKTMTLAQKAAHYEEITRKRHNRYGFVTGCLLKKPGDPEAGVIHEASDNDGLWTAVYVAAQSFRYATTKDSEARASARKSMWAMLDLVRYTGIPGFPARAIIRKNEKDVTGYDPEETVRVRGETDKIWFTSPVDPEVLCKGDTSSDEMDGHYFAWYVYHELVADAAEKAEIARVVRACTDHILRNDLTLVGHTGRKTRWGVWHPRFINDDPTWWEERGLNALEILCFLKVAEHICQEPRYGARYRELIEKHHYLLNTVDQKVTQLGWHLVNHSDDQMAFMMYYCLLQLEKDPDIRRVLLQSLERSWKIERPEASPFFNFVYGALTGNPCDAEAAVFALQDWPWELIEWQMRGTHRSDVTLLHAPLGGRVRVQTAVALPPSERRLMRWNGNPYQPDGGTPNGESEEDGSAWLMPYWMGRYHRLFTER
ncbi:MAG: two-component regulator propeller domain-containing protein [Chloroherpetonaceae bacterium]|nr:hypothetical protein [Chthonomonadaceae bacterium]MDW8207561.1 two-component regulator propeller domain-containing protein [Chloroherpetonaceae bacterium]